MQAWADYGLGAVCGLLSFSIRPVDLEEIASAIDGG